MKNNWLNTAGSYLSAVRQMAQLAWQAQPAAIIGLILLQIVQGLIPVISAWLTKRLFDLLGQAITRTISGNFIQLLLPVLVALAIVEILLQLFSSINSFLTSDLSRKLTLNTEAMIYRQIAQLDGLAYFDTPQFYDTIRLATQGAGNGPLQLLNTASGFLQSTVTLVSFLGILVFINPLLAVVIGIASIPQLVVQFKLNRQHLGLALLNSPKERRAFYLRQVLSSIPFVKEIRLFNLSAYFLEQFIHTARDVQHTQRKQQLREMRWQLGLGTLSSLVSGVAFIVIASEAFTGRISLGDVTLYTSALGSVQGALIGIILAFSSLNESVLFFDYFAKLMTLPPAIPVANPAQQVPLLQSGIELRDVSFRYSEQHPWVLRHVNLFIPKGKCVALVGLNGAGKTTLVKLLTRLYDPSEGQILWDGIDIRELDPVELRQRMGVIFQDFVHYDLTVQENIGLGYVDEVYNEQRVRQSAQKVGIQDWLDNLPQGYQTVLSRWLSEDAQGIDLSSGQWQKIAIARMFMRNAEFLILDEPTASLDAQSEYEIYQHFVELTSDRSSFLISHRFSTVRMADLIAVLEDGRITEFGTHVELVNLSGAYKRLYEMQVELYNHESKHESTPH